MGLTIGVDIGGTKILAGVVDENGAILDRVKIATPRNSEQTAAAIAQAAQSVRKDYPVEAVGLGAAGFISADRATVLVAPNMSWHDEPLKANIEALIDLPVVVENDANAAALAEQWKGAATGTGDVVFVLAGLSPGAGALIGGRLHRGFMGAAGEIGALHLLGREAAPEHLLSTTGTPLHPLDETAVARVFALARQGDPQAVEAVDRFLRRLVHDVAALVLAMDPELVVVGGWAAGLDGVLDPLRERLARYCLIPPKVTLSALGPEAIATGALRLALDHVEEQLFAVERTSLPHM